MNLTAAMTQFFGQALASVHTALPAKVTKADNENGLVSVVPTIRIPMENGVEIEVPELQDVPVVYPQAAAFDLHFPVAVDDLVLLVFLETSPAKWREGDGIQPVSPADTGRFQLGSAVAIPGLYPKRKKGACTLEVDDQGHITFTAEQVTFDAPAVFKQEVTAEGVATFKERLSAKGDAFVTGNLVTASDLFVGQPGGMGDSFSAHQHTYVTAAGAPAPTTPQMPPVPVPIPPEV